MLSTTTRVCLSRCALLLAFLMATQTTAQNFRGGINGTVIDPSGALVANASVSATNVATSVLYRTVSSSAGQFAFQDLPLGAYDVVVSGTGFQTRKIGSVPVSAGGMYTLSARLELASVTTHAEVMANAADVSLDTTTVHQTTVIPDKAIQDVPMNGRDFTQFSTITPGMAGYVLGGGRFAQW
jgi:hypothetical protein